MSGVNTTKKAEKAFSPIAARDRIREIKISMSQLEAEQRSLVSALKAEGFILIAKVITDAVAFVWDGKFQVGDTVEALEDYADCITKGGAYKVDSVHAGWGGMLLTCMGDGDTICSHMSKFKVVARPK